MEYQVVLQFQGDSLDDNDTMVSFEDKLIEELDQTADVDGHDVGSAEINVFVNTTDPTQTLRKAKPLLKSLDLLDNVTIAYRKMGGDEYTVLWPQPYDKVFKVT